MKPMGDTNQYVMKVRAMAKAVGVDLASAADLGGLTQEDWSKMITLCRGCEWDEGCARFLAQSGREMPTSIPENCVNREKLRDLQTLFGGLE